MGYSFEETVTITSHKEQFDAVKVKLDQAGIKYLQNSLAFNDMDEVEMSPGEISIITGGHKLFVRSENGDLIQRLFIILNLGRLQRHDVLEQVHQTWNGAKFVTSSAIVVVVVGLSFLISFFLDSWYAFLGVTLLSFIPGMIDKFRHASFLRVARRHLIPNDDE